MGSYISYCRWALPSNQRYNVSVRIHGVDGGTVTAEFETSADNAERIRLICAEITGVKPFVSVFDGINKGVAE